MYAYIYHHPTNGIPVYGHSDDGEWGASRGVMEELLTSGATNKLVVVTRYFGGQMLGRARFDIYKNAARMAATPPR